MFVYGVRRYGQGLLGLIVMQGIIGGNCHVKF